MRNLVCIPGSILCCPACKSQVDIMQDEVSCSNTDCHAVYPIVNGTPVMIVESRSLVSLSAYDHVFDESSQHGSKNTGRIRRILERYAPTFSSNLSSKRCFARFVDLIQKANTSPLVLVVGCGTGGKGTKRILSNPAVRVINTDISPKAKADVFCDGHDLPFADESADGIIVQAVLEHVVDPERCVREMYRVLKPSGIVYSEIPFMQQGHFGGYDFTRFTHIGHRRLFRYFEEIDSGVVAGAGTALGWSYEHFLKCFATSRVGIKIMSVVARVTGFWLKYFDYLQQRSPVSIDAASCTYFFGRKRPEALSDREIVSQYRGAQ